MPRGLKHTVQCHCVLPQYKNAANPVFHKFIVFSVIDDSDTCIAKIVNCNNCGATHKVFDLCKSELLVGREDARSVLTIDDFKHSLPESLFELLNSYQREVYDFEYSRFIIDNKLWDSSIVLTKEHEDDKIEGKIVKFLSHDKFRVESFSHREVVE